MLIFVLGLLRAALDIRLTTEYVVAAMGGGVIWLDLAIVVTLEDPVPDSATFFEFFECVFAVEPEEFLWLFVCVILGQDRLFGTCCYTPMLL